jgi:hypothetical protein
VAASAKKIESVDLAGALDFLARGGREAPAVAPMYDLPRASNLIEWTTDPRFLDFSLAFGHWGQYQFLRDIAQLRCPLCNPFDKDSEGPGRCWGKTRMELEAEVLLGYSADLDTDVCPRCRSTREELVTDGLLYDYNTAIVCIGARAGKSASAAVLATYLEHVIYSVAQFDRDRLARVLKQAPGTRFDIAFVASTGKQTEKTIWDWFTNFRERGPWIRRYVKRIKELEAAQPRIGLKRWQYDEEATKSIRNGLIRVELDSLTSNSGGMAGATRLAAFVDELARFDLTESKRGADEVWRVLSMSLKTVRRAASISTLPSYLFGMKISTSSPMSMDDKMMSLLAKQDVLDRMFAIKAATWEFNPFMPREAFDEEYAEDPIQAERDFGANPPLTETPLIEDVPRFAKSVEPALSPTTLFHPIYPEDALGRQYIGVEVEDSIISPEMPRFFCFDAGASFDSFAGACAHPAWIEVAPDPSEQGGHPRRILVTVYDWVVRILPTEKPKRTVWFDSVVKLVEKLKDCFRVTQVCFDRWQSESLIQDIRAFGVQAEQASITARDFVAFKSDCYGGKVKLLPPVRLPDGRFELEFTEAGQLVMNRTPVEMSPQGVGIYELVKLSRSPDLRKVFNPNKGRRRGYDSDDVAQVLVGVHRMIQEAVADDPANKSHKDRLRRETMGGEQWGGGGIARTMSSWSVQQPSRPAGSFRSTKNGVIGYTSGDTFIGPNGEANRVHQFGGRGSVKMRRW